MSTISNQRGARGRAGCPPVLEVDLVHPDVSEPAVEWPPAPPTRQGHTSTRTTSDPDLTQLTAARAIRLLDASIEHLRTTLETSDDDITNDRVERAIADIARARETLTDLDVIDVTD